MVMVVWWRERPHQNDSTTGASSIEAEAPRPEALSPRAGERILWAKGLECQPRAELDLSTGVGVRDHAASGNAYSGTRLPKVGIVEGVEGIRAHLEVVPIRNPEGLAEAEIHIAPVRAAQHVAARIAEGVRRRDGKRRGIEPVVDGWMRH